MSAGGGGVGWIAAARTRLSRIWPENPKSDTPKDLRRALDALDAVLAAVGDEMAVVGGDYDAGWSEGWNACREAAVRAIEGDA